MSRKIQRTILFALIAYAMFAVQIHAQTAARPGHFSDSAQATLPATIVSAQRIVLLGQDEPTEKPGLFDRMKRAIANWANDNELNHEKSRREPPAPQASVSIPTRPPKPIRITEASRSPSQTEQATTGRRADSAQSQNTTRTESRQSGRPVSRTGLTDLFDEESDADLNTELDTQPDEESIFKRLETMREQVFNADDLEASLARDAFSSASSAPRTAPQPAPLAQPPRQTQPQPTVAQRTPPPQTTIDTIVREMPDRETSRNYASTPTVVDQTDVVVDRQPIPLPTRTNRQPLASANQHVAQNSSQAQPTLIPSASPTHAPTQKIERSTELSGIDVRRNRSLEVVQNQTAQRQKTQSELPAESPQATRRNPSQPDSARPASETPRHGGSDDEYQIAARRMLSTEQTFDAAQGAPNLAQSSEKTLMVSPRLEVETEGDPRAIVGQEAEYRIRVFNRGGATAEQIVLSVEIPEWIDIRQPDVSDGTTSIIPRPDSNELRDFTWKLSRIEAGSNALLVLRLVPKQRKSMDLKISYDFFRPAAVTKMVVQEPVIEMELEGPDEVLWGTRVGYRLLVRNTGNGDAEQVLLELLQTGSDMKSCPLPLLKAGEEQVIDVDVWTGKQEYIDINIQATGKYGVATKVSRRVKVLRPNLLMTVDAPSTHFVGSPAEFVVKIRNIGDAPARDIELAAAIPLGAQFSSCSEGGALTPQNQVVWKIENIAIGDMFTATVVCEPKREGACKLDAVVNDKSGELASCSSVFDATAIVQLKLDVETPQGPVEVGGEAIYTLHVENRGTKAAENVAITVFFGKNLEPFAIEGGTAYTNDGQVVFDKIPTLGPAQKLSLKVKARADAAGSHRVRSEVVCNSEEINLVNEQATYFFQKEKRKNTASSLNESPGTRVGQSAEMPLRTASVPMPVPPVVEPLPKTAQPETPPAIPAPLEVPVAEIPTENTPATTPPEEAKPVDPFLQQ